MRRASFVISVAVLLLLSGCATAGGGAGSAASPSSPSPTAACPQQPGVELPPGCVGYDPEEAMAQNDRYPERLPLPGDDPAATATLVDQTRAALETLRAGGAWSEDAVRQTLASLGFNDIQTRSGAGDVLFGAPPPDGGCVYGAVEAEGVTVEAGGYILDGGCLAAQ